MDLNTVLTFEAICKVYINYFVPFEICSISTVIVIVVTVISFTLCLFLATYCLLLLVKIQKNLWKCLLFLFILQYFEGFNFDTLTPNIMNLKRKVKFKTAATVYFKI